MGNLEAEMGAYVDAAATPPSETSSVSFATPSVWE
jgi:hypothetical protein